jgi:hypothetical protein
VCSSDLTLGPLNIAPPAFIDYKPARFLRPFDRRTESTDSESFQFDPLILNWQFTLALPIDHRRRIVS